jgi:tetratricopeptide (TPR) repeat protein
MVPEFTVTVRPIVRHPELVLRKRFRNGVFRIDGLQDHEYQIQVDSKPYTRVRMDVAFHRTASATQFRMVILHRAADRPGMALAANTVPTEESAAAGTSRRYCEEGVRLLNNGMLEEALASLGVCMRRFPNYVPALADIGSIYILLNRPDAALAYLRHAHRLDSSNAAVRLNMALAYHEKQNFGEASKILEALLEDQGMKSLSLYYLARIHYDQKKYKLAEKTVRLALQEDPDLLDGWLLLVNLSIEQKNHGAVREGMLQLRKAMNNRLFTEFVEEQLASLRN